MTEPPSATARFPRLRDRGGARDQRSKRAVRRACRVAARAQRVRSPRVALTRRPARLRRRGSRQTPRSPARDEIAAPQHGSPRGRPDQRRDRLALQLEGGGIHDEAARVRRSPRPLELFARRVLRSTRSTASAGPPACQLHGADSLIRSTSCHGREGSRAVAMYFVARAAGRRGARPGRSRSPREPRPQCGSARCPVDGLVEALAACSASGRGPTRQSAAVLHVGRDVAREHEDHAQAARGRGMSCATAPRPPWARCRTRAARQRSSRCVPRQRERDHGRRHAMREMRARDRPGALDVLVAGSSGSCGRSRSPIGQKARITRLAEAP